MRNVRLASLTTGRGTKPVWAFELPSSFCPGWWTEWIWDGCQFGLRCDLPYGVSVAG